MAEAATAADVGVSRPRCVVADDHPALLRAVTDHLEHAQIDVVRTAADGTEALAAAQTERPDAAVVDFRMPRLAGLELLVRLHDAVPEMRVVVYTAEADESVVRGALAAGASAVLLKEAPLADLTRALTAALAGSTYLDPALARFAVGSGERAPLLTDRERSVLALVAEGLAHEEIGRRLGISAETVRTHVRKASGRLGAATRTEAVAKAFRLGLIA